MTHTLLGRSLVLRRSLVRFALVGWQTTPPTLVQLRTLLLLTYDGWIGMMVTWLLGNFRVLLQRWIRCDPFALSTFDRTARCEDPIETRKPTKLPLVHRSFPEEVSVEKWPRNLLLSLGSLLALLDTLTLLIPLLTVGFLLLVAMSLEALPLKREGRTPFKFVGALVVDVKDIVGSLLTLWVDKTLLLVGILLTFLPKRLTHLKGMN